MKFHADETLKEKFSVTLLERLHQEQTFMVLDGNDI